MKKYEWYRQEYHKIANILLIIMSLIAIILCIAMWFKLFGIENRMLIIAVLMFCDGVFITITEVDKHERKISQEKQNER